MNPKAIPNQICILWHPQEAAPSDALIRALSKRGFAVMPTSSMHTVFAAACHYSKGTPTVSDRELGVLGVVVVFDDRESLTDADSVLDALERFAPSTLCWEHQAGMNPPMVPVVRRVVKQAPIKADHRVSSSSPSSSPQALRLVGESEQPGSSNQEHTPRPAPISARDVLDADELDALLAGEIGDGKRGK